MPSTASIAPLHLVPTVSRRLRLLLAVAHGGAMLLVSQLALSLLWRLDLVCLLALSLAWYWSRLARLPTLIWEGEGRWLWQMPGGAPEPVELQTDTVVTRWLVLLNFRTTDGVSRSLLLPGDTLEPSTLRRLRVRLRLEAARADQARGR